MSARSVWLVRHASTAWTGVRWSGRSDPPLTETGLAEATRLAGRLGPALGMPASIVSSPSRRAAQTAELIAAVAGAPVDIDDDLGEVDIGLVDGLTPDELGAAFPDLAATLQLGTRDIDWPGGEASAALLERALRVWTRLADRALQADVVAVSHGGLIGSILRLALPPEAVPVGPIGPASAIQLVDTDAGWRPTVLESP